MLKNFTLFADIVRAKTVYFNTLLLKKVKGWK